MFKVWRIINLIDHGVGEMVVDNLWIGTGVRSSDEIAGVLIKKPIYCMKCIIELLFEVQLRQSLRYQRSI